MSMTRLVLILIWRSNDGSTERWSLGMELRSCSCSSSMLFLIICRICRRMLLSHRCWRLIVLIRIVMLSSSIRSWRQMSIVRSSIVQIPSSSVTLVSRPSPSSTSMCATTTTPAPASILRIRVRRRRRLSWLWRRRRGRRKREATSAHI